MGRILQLVKIIAKKFGLGGIYTQGQFASYDLALQSLGTSGYENESFASSLKQRTKSLIPEILSGKGYQNDDLLIISAISLAAKNEPVNVMDIGGGFGMHYVKSNRLIGDKIKSWTVLETQAMVAESNDFRDDKLRFCSELEEVGNGTGDLDIALFASSVHYLPDPFGTLKQLCEKRPAYIYIARTPMTDSKSGYVALQRSPSSFSFQKGQKDAGQTKVVRYPVNIISREALVAALDPYYEVQFETKNPKSRFYVNWESLEVHNILFKRRN